MVIPPPVGESMENFYERLLGLKDIAEKIELELNKSKTVNKDGIPIGIDVFADVESIGKVVLGVERRCYKVRHIGGQDIYGGKEFNSLSAAAEFFSGIKRKSGWIYWRTLTTGRTLKDAYKG